MTDIATLFADSQPHNSDFQVERFGIVANGGTPFGCYMQVLRDLRTSYDALATYYFELEKLALDLEEAESRSDEDETRPTIDARRARLAAAHTRARIAAVEHFAADQARVFGKLLAFARAWKKAIGPLTPSRREEYERDLWEHRVKSAIAAELMSGAPALSRSTLEMIAALPIDMRTRIWAKTASGQDQIALIEWWRMHAPTVPEVEPVPIDEVRKLVWHSRSHPLTLV